MQTVFDLKEDSVSDILAGIHAYLVASRDNEIQCASEVLASYVTDHRDNAVYRENDRQVSRLATAWDMMIHNVAQWQDKAQKIEARATNFYGR